jgi:hypothetical protein
VIRSRWLVRLLVLGLAPVLVLALPRVADAVESYGDPATATVDDNYGGDSFAAGSDLDCTLTGYWIVDSAAPSAAHISYSWDCGTGWNVTDPLIAWKPVGSGCEFAFSTLQNADSGGSGTFAPASVEGAMHECFVTELCWEGAASFLSNPWYAQTDEGCVTWDLGAPGQVEEIPECTAGEPTRPSFSPAGVGANGRTYENVNLNVTGPGIVASQWGFYVVHTGSGSPVNNSYDLVASGQQRVWPAGAALVPNTFAVDFSASAAAPNFPYTFSVMQGSRTDRPPPAPYYFDVVGVGVVHLPTLMATTGMGSSAARASLKQLPQEVIVGVPFGQVGVTDGATCSFYWGEKIADIPSSKKDDPIFPLDDGEWGTEEPPVVEPPTVNDPGDEDGDGEQDSFCGWTANPLSWGRAVICLVGKLFIPETPIRDRMASIGEAYEDRAPFSWLTFMADIPTSIPGGGVGFSGRSQLTGASELSASGCPDWRIEVGDLDQNIVCGNSFTDAIRDIRPALLGLMSILAFWPLIRGTYYGAIPIINVKKGSD